MKIDLHMHTNNSDGMLSVDELMELVCSKGIKTIAITDHDTLSHLDYARKRADHYKLHFIPGVELSCYNFNAMKKVHLVALGLSGDTKEVRKLCRQATEGRNSYHFKLISKIRDMGYDISYEEAKKFSFTGNVFKIHLYMAIKKKYPETDINFYKKHFMETTGNSSDLEMNYIDIKTGIKTVLDCGGIPILAHPSLYDSFPDVEEYISYGLKGMEISHPDLSDSDVIKARELCDRYHLIPSGGTDFHMLNQEPMLGNYGLSEEEFAPLKDIMEFY